MQLNKSYLTNGIALGVTLLALMLEGPAGSYLLAVGLFALSGALTNTLAIHMLFERVPFLYGSGVITLRFDAFKASIADMIMQEFLTIEHIEKFTRHESKKGIDLTPVLERVDLHPAFEGLVEMIMSSSIGGMLGMFGGEKMVRQFQEPFETKMRQKMIEISKEEQFAALIREHLIGTESSHQWFVKIESLVLARLEELTPEMVKKMIQRIIREHLGWLVVWGGVFGGLIGLLSALLIS